MVDIIIIGVLVLCAVIGAYRGLLQSLAGVIIVVAAFLGASLAADALSPAVAEWIGPMVEESIQEKLLQSNTADVGGMLGNFHFSGGSLQKMTEEIMDKATQTGMSILNAVTESVTHSVAYALTYFISFLILLLLLWLAMKPLKLMTRLPGLHMLNCIGGGALGLVWGTLLTFLAVWLMLRFDWLLTPEMLKSSPVLRFFAENSPISLLTSL